MDAFPALFSDEEFDSFFKERQSSSSEPAARVLSDPEQLIQSIATISVRFPHITTRIEAIWGSNELQEYLSRLITETQRSNGDKRQGFPPDIMAHLLKIHNIHFRSLGKPLPTLDWGRTRRK